MELQTDVTGASMHPIVHQPLPLDRIICGDNCEVMRTLPSESIDLVVTSPPYDDLRTYGGHGWDFYGVAWNLKRLLKPGGVIVWVVGDTTKEGTESGSSFTQANHFKSIGLNLHDTMVFLKVNPIPQIYRKRYRSDFEFMFVLSKGTPKTHNALMEPCKHAGLQLKGTTYKNFSVGEQSRTKKANPVKENKIKGNVWPYVVGKKAEDQESVGHPAPFPCQLARDHILSWSNEGDVVLDPFSGSGTTAKVAFELGRRYIGIEVNPEYVAISQQRLAQRGVL